MGGLASRLLTAAIAVMPPSRHCWGKAMLAELGYTHSRRARARLVLAGIRVALLPPPGLAGYARAAGRASLIAVLAWIPLATGLYLTNVVFPSPQDNTFGVLSMDLYLVLALMMAGAVARRASAKLGAAVIAGMAAGLILAALGMGTFAVIDNAFLSVVSHQQAKIDGFRASGMTSMRAYINADLEATAPGVAILLTLLGAFFASLGAMADRELRTARSEGKGGARPDRQGP